MRRGGIITLAAVIILLAGIGIFLYPTVSDQLNRYRQAEAVKEYNNKVLQFDPEECERMLAEAEAFNAAKGAGAAIYDMTEEEKAQYEALLNIAGDGMMGYIDIPKTETSLPVYHGTEEKVLQNAIGHLESTSLPVGGETTHCVISGHRGLPAARLFTDIDRLEKGDHFMIRVLNRTVTYEVDDISVLLPEEMEGLRIEEGEDYCTLVTCTPYGVNTHRLLVRGTRIPNEEDETAYTAKPFRLATWLVAILAAAPVLLIIIIILLIKTGRGKRGKH